MKPLAALVFMALFAFGSMSRADYVDEAQDLSPPLTESDTDTRDLWSEITPEGFPVDSLVGEETELDTEQGDTLSDVQPLEDLSP